MRFVVGTLLLLSVSLCSIVGVLQVLSADYVKFQAKTDVGDLSAVSSDLVDEAQLKKMEAETAKKIGAAGQKELILGVVSFVLAALQLAAVFLSFLGRLRRVVLVVILLSSAGLLASMVLDTVIKLSIVALGALVLALIFFFLDTSPHRTPAS